MCIGKYIKENNNSLELKLGKVNDLKQIGQGGSGVVYSGILNGNEVVIKFLLDSENKKLARFKAEYYNIQLLDYLSGIVKYINYEELKLKEDYIVPIIIMKKYRGSLKNIRSEIDSNEVELMKLFKFLARVLGYIHKNGIVHRDIKPENILVDNNADYVLGDFGIASYDPEIFTMKAKTEKGDRLANYDFSAPEQSLRDVYIKPTPSMDIYALGQVCQWFMFGRTHKGTMRKRFVEKYNTDIMDILDCIVDKCICNDEEERYQSIDEVLNNFNYLKDEKSKVDPYQEMNKLGNDIVKSYPRAYRKITNISDFEIVKRLINNIKQEEFNNKLWFNNGEFSDEIDRLDFYEDDRILINEFDLKLESIWVFHNESLYTDFILVDCDLNNNEPFIIDGEKSIAINIIDGKHIVDSSSCESGYVDINGDVLELSKYKVDYIDRYNYSKYYLIGTEWSSCILEENDNFLQELKGFKKLDVDIMLSYIKKIKVNKHIDVRMRL